MAILGIRNQQVAGSSMEELRKAWSSRGVSRPTNHKPIGRTDPRALMAGTPTMLAEETPAPSQNRLSPS
jgi:hypothetical protein